MASVLQPATPVTVRTDHTYFVRVSGRGFASVERSSYELRRHLSAMHVWAPQIVAGGGYSAARIGRPPRAWTSSELAAMLATLPAVQIDARAGWPITLTVEPADAATDVATLAADMIRTGASTAATAGRGALDAAGTAAQKVVSGVAAGVAVSIGVQIAIAAAVLVALYVFRKPLGKLVREVV